MAKKNKKKENRRKPQSAELAEGSSFTLEDAASAYYLAALLAEAYAREFPHDTQVDPAKTDADRSTTEYCMFAG